MQEKPPLILTARLDSDSFEFFNRLRQKFFPPERNFLDAHLTLFHKLPPDIISEIKGELEKIAPRAAPVALKFTGIYSLGRGAAVKIEAPPLTRLRGEIARRFERDLSAQDGQKFNPHITVQNKVSKEEAARSFEILKSIEIPSEGKAPGLDLWEYLGGEWGFVRHFKFENDPV